MITLGHPAYEELLERLRTRAGLVFPDVLAVDIAAAATRAMQRAGVERVEDYVEELDSGRVSLSELIEEVTVGETYFFREPDQFHFLRTVVAADLAARLEGRGPRVWSAACATGEEAYSLSILLHQIGMATYAHVLGTDISRESLEAARAGEYGAWSFRNADGRRAAPYFKREGERWKVRSSVRRTVTFEQLNLAQPTFPSAVVHHFDLVLCRNVLIYLDRQVIADVARRLYECLAEGGWLVCASSDPPLADFAPFHLVPTQIGMFYRRLSPAARAPGPTPAGLVEAPALPSPKARRSSRLRIQQSTPETPVATHASTPDAPAEIDNPPATLENAADRVRQRPLDPEARYVLAMAELASGEERRAMESLRKALYLDGAFVMAHLALGVSLQRTGDADAARRAFQSAARLCRKLPADAEIPFADGASPRHLTAVAEHQLTMLPAPGRSRG